MAVDLTIQRCCRLELRALIPSFYTADRGLDPAVVEATVAVVKARHGELLRQQQDRMLREIVLDQLQDESHDSRRRKAPAPAADPGAPAMLPGFAEIADEYYTDSENRRWRLVDMSLERLKNTITYYARQEQAYHERLMRLRRFAAAMEARGLGAQATVRDLYIA